jgi:hypothetical protein
MFFIQYSGDFMKTFLRIMLFFFLVTHIGFAQWPQDSTSKVNVCTAAGDQKYPEVTFDCEGGAIIVWQDERNSSPNIYAQRIDSSGAAVWTTNGILLSNIENSRHPKLISDGDGGAFITWFDFRNGWPNSSVQVQRVNGNGEILWQDNGVTIANAANSWAYPEITGYRRDGAIVTWIGVNGEVYAQKIDTAGNLLWPVDSVMLTVSGSLPQIAVDDSGGVIVCWFDYASQASETNVFAQRVDSEGNVKWDSNGVPICLAPNYQHKPDLVADGKGGAIISWLDSRYSPDNYIFAQQVDWKGDTCWAANGLQVSSIKGYYRSLISTDKQGGAILTWMGGITEDIYVQHIDTSGTALWANDLKLTENTNPYIPGIISDGAKGAIVIWENETDSKIKVQHISSDGTLSFPASGKMVSSGNGLNGFFAATTDGAGKAIIVWEDTPSFNTNIYTQRVIIPNFITGTDEEPSVNLPSDFLLSQNFPNPFNPNTTISWQSPVGSHQTIKVFDVLGNEIATLVNEYKPAGRYEVEFNAEKLASGIYFYKLQAVPIGRQAGEYTAVKKMILIK